MYEIKYQNKKIQFDEYAIITDFIQGILNCMKGGNLPIPGFSQFP